NFRRKMCQVGSPEIVTHAGASAVRINIGSAAPREHIVRVYGAKIDTQPCVTRCVRNRGMHLCSRKEEDATGRANDSNLGIQLHRLFRTGLFAGIGADLLRSDLPASSVPYSVVVVVRSVLNGMSPIARMKSHDIFRLNFVNGYPPVDLAKRRGIP